MTRWTPLSIYLTALAYTTAVVILLGTFAVQFWSERATIRGTGVPAPTSHESSHRIEAVKPASRSFHTDSASVSSVGAIPGTHNRAFFALDGGRGHWSSQYGVRHAPARKLSCSLRVFTETGRGPLTPWRPDLIAASHLCGVDIPLLASLVGRESGWDPWALSKVGARGLTQVMPATAAEFAPGMNLWNPAENLVVGGCWLRKLIDQYRGDVRTALHAYHAGGGTVRRKQVKQVTLDYANDVILGSAN